MPNLVKLNKNFLNGKVETNIEVSPPATEPDVVAAFASNSSFPYRQIELGKISARAETGHEIIFGDDAGKVAFIAQGGISAGFGVYPDPQKLLDRLSVNEIVGPGLDLEKDPNSLYVALAWGYDVAASMKGSVALGAPGAVNLSGTAKREALYAVIRRINKDSGALTAVDQTVSSWMLPSQINKLQDLEPGTWLMAEVSGSLALSLGVLYGYNFNWVREAKLLGLSGDIGLHLNAGVSAALNLTASGNFAVVISRDPKDAADQTLRFRLFRLRQNGWGFAFNAGASVDGNFEEFLPEFDEFVKAVFGIHGAQVLKDLKAIEKWTNPEQSLGEILSGEGVKFGEDFLGKVTGMDPKEAFDQAKQRLSSFLTKWDALPHNLTTKLWKLVESKADLAGIRNLAKTVSEANIDTVKKPIANLLSDVDFFRSPAGTWLIAAASKGIFNAINGQREFDDLQKAARQTLEILDGGALETVLKKLQDYIEEHLNLEQLFPGLGKIEKLFGIDSLQNLDQASFDAIDDWLKARLAAFVDKKLDELKLTEINEIRRAIFLFINHGRSFYTKTLKALNRKYEFNFAYTFQSSTTKTALLDLSLDFSQPNVIEALRQALGGKYDDLLVTQKAGVRINLGTLTHQIDRNSHVEINLPWFKSTVDHINTSLAKVDTVDEESGRLFVYELKADDIVSEKSKRQSRLAVGGFLKTPANQVRVHSSDELTYSYSFRQVKKNMKRADLQYQLKPYVRTYLNRVFNPVSPGNGTFDNWIGELDKQIDALEPNGEPFGNTLISLELGLPATVASAWLEAHPEPSNGGNKPAVYLNMSRRIQAKIKETLPLIYFSNLDHFQDIDPAAVLLVYSAMPPSTSISFDGTNLKLNTDRDYYWDYNDDKKRAAMVLSAWTKGKLSVTLERVHNLLLESGMTGTASFFNPDRVDLIQKSVANSAENDLKLRSLLFVENDIIKAARRAGFEIAKFTAINTDQPSEAVKALAKFGAKVTSAFNEKIASLYGGSALRPLGTSIFIEAASELKPGLSVGVTAMLELVVLKKAASFEMLSFLEGEVPAKSDILVHERVLNIN